MGEIKFKENSFGFFAEYDLQNMRETFQLRVGTPSACCVHAEQAIEKLFKHVRKEQGCKPGSADLTGHHLLKLAESVGFERADEFRDEFISLSKMYFEGRYPNDTEYYLFVMPTWQEVERAVNLAELVYDWVKEYLSGQKSNESGGLKRMHLK